MVSPSDFHLWTTRLFHELALFSTSGYLLVGFSELAIDLIWVLMALFALFQGGERFGWHGIERLPPERIGTSLCVLVPAYNEAAVITQMLSNAKRQYAGREVHIFVGCYSCDPETIACVHPLCDAGLSMVVIRRDGGTTKADCLNAIWNGVLAHERKAHRKFDGCILHDAEDVVDGEEARVFAAFVDCYAMIQLPVIPLRHPSSPWISGHYCDEFAEAHGKVMMVRQAIGAALPSAGVGCMIRRDAMDALARGNRGPFDERSATEDYEFGLRLRELGFPTAFLRVRSQSRFGVVATSAYFPCRLGRAIAQKTRWVSGISLAGWDRLGWGRGFAENWMRLRDRMAVLGALIGVAGYAATLLGLAMAGLGWTGIGPPLAIDPGTVTLIWVVGHLFVWRLAVRVHFVSENQSFAEAMLSIPRTAVSGIVAMCTGLKAVLMHLRELRTGEVVLEKTNHSFPGPAP